MLRHTFYNMFVYIYNWVWTPSRCAFWLKVLQRQVPWSSLESTNFVTSLSSVYLLLDTFDVSHLQLGIGTGNPGVCAGFGYLMNSTCHDEFFAIFFIENGWEMTELCLFQVWWSKVQNWCHKRQGTPRKNIVDESVFGWLIKTTAFGFPDENGDDWANWAYKGSIPL